MKNYLILLIPLFLWGCASKYNGVIDTGSSNYQVTFVNSSNDTLFVPSDSLIVVSISLNSIAGIKSIYFNINDPDGNLLNSSPVPLFDDGNLALHGDEAKDDKTYSNKYPFSQSFINGKYTIQYYIVNNTDQASLVAVRSFNYNNNITDFSPVVSNLVVPDSVTLDTVAININLSIQASDPNGLKDIDFVFFNSFKPNGDPATGNPFYMYDDGRPEHGDAVAGDGIYSLIISLPPGTTKGTYRWEFQAQDR
ncbi:MAG: hypothetical protein P4L35_18945, partial [Ignavibacteriaceae bacterium]|nr:hypothetical protein [Ignavibacteriaceae bacterium]